MANAQIVSYEKDSTGINTNIKFTCKHVNYSTCSDTLTTTISYNIVEFENSTDIPYYIF